jgi:hypothetical protein
VPGFSRHGQKFTLYVFRHSYGLERAHGHVPGCYFCLTSIAGVTAKSRHIVQYPNLPSAVRPVPHSADLPVPKPLINMTLSDSESSDEDVGQANNNIYCDPTMAGACSSNEPHLPTHGDLNDDRDLNLSKKKAEL